MQFIPVYQPSLSGSEKKYVNECLDTNWISSKGSFIEKFEQQFAGYIGANYATTVANGTVALHLALLALDIQPGDEIIVPTFTYVASVNAIDYMRAVPVFVDSLADTWQLDPADVARHITTKTRAILAVHLYGHPCEMAALQKLAKQHNLLLIEDCAEAFGSYYKKQHVGTFGDIATFSFYGNKTITTGEGGMVTTQNQTIYERMKHLKNQGVDKNRQYWHDIVGYNYRLTNIGAALGLAQLEQADAFIAKKRLLAESYASRLAALPLQTHREIGDVVHSYWMCSILLDDPKLKDPLRNHLAQAGIETRPLFYPVHTMPMFQHLTNETFSTANRLAESGINLPSWPGLAENQINYICEEIKNFFQKNQ